MSPTTGHANNNNSHPTAPTTHQHHHRRRTSLQEITLANEGNGTHMHRPIISSALRLRPAQDFTYLVHEPGLPGRWILTDRTEAQHYHALGYAVYNSFEPFVPVAEWTHPVAPPAGPGFAAQQREVSDVLEAEEEANDPEYAEWKKRGNRKIRKQKQSERGMGMPSIAAGKGRKSPPGSGGSKEGSPGAGSGAGTGVTA